MISIDMILEVMETRNCQLEWPLQMSKSKETFFFFTFLEHLAGSVTEHVILDLWVVTLSPVLGTEII